MEDSDAFESASEGKECVSSDQFTAYLRATFPGCDDDSEFASRVHSIVENHGSDGVLSRDEFLTLWKKVLEKCFRPKSALLVVDYQNDFIDGTLSLKQCPLKQDPGVILSGLNELIAKFDEVVYSLDWHPEDHISFIENRALRKLHVSSTNGPEKVKVTDELIFEINDKPYVQKMWPRHCVQCTEGAKLHEKLTVKNDAIVVKKGTNPEVDSYSAFWDNNHANETGLKKSLIERGITNLYVVGLAFDACVLFTALDAVAEGFTTSVVEDLTAGISETLTAEAISKLAEIECPRISSKGVPQQLSGAPLPWIYVWQQARRLKTC